MREGQIDATLAQWDTIARRIRDPVLAGMIIDLLAEHRAAGDGDQDTMGIVFFDDDIAAVQRARGTGAAHDQDGTAR